MSSGKNSLKSVIPPRSALLRRFVSGAVSVSSLLFFTTAVYASSNDAQMNLAAETDFAKIPNLADPRFLDQFVFDFTGTPAANTAFTLRYELARAKQSTEDLNEFIGLYPNTVPGVLAVEDVYTLYHERGTVSDYFEFMRLYPDSPFSYHAKLRAQTLLFEFAKDLALDHEVDIHQRIAVLDDFIISNPGAPQTEAAAALARGLAVLGAREEREAAMRAIARQVLEDYGLWTELTQNLSAGPDDWDGNVTRNLIPSPSFETFSGIRNEILKKQQIELNALKEISVTSFINAYSIYERHAVSRRDADAGPEAIHLASTAIDQRLLSARYRVDRAAEIILIVYPDTDAPREVRNEQRHAQIINELREIRVLMQRQHEELISVIREEFQKTRAVIEQGFRDTGARLDLLQESVSIANETLLLVATEINKVNHQLRESIERAEKRAARAETLLQEISSQVGESIQATERMSDRLHKDLMLVTDSVRHMHIDVSQGLAQQTDQLVALRRDTVTGFADLSRGQDTIIETIGAQQQSQEQQHLEIVVEMQRARLETQESLDRIDQSLSDGFTVVDEALHQGFQGNRHELAKLVEQGARHHSESLRQNRDLNRNVISNMRQVNAATIREMRRDTARLEAAIDQQSERIETAMYDSARMVAASGHNRFNRHTLHDDRPEAAVLYDVLQRLPAEALRNPEIGRIVNQYLEHGATSGVVTGAALEMVGMGGYKDHVNSAISLLTGGVGGELVGGGLGEVCDMLPVHKNDCNNVRLISSVGTNIMTGNWIAAANDVARAAGDSGSLVGQAVTGVRNAIRRIF